MNARLLYFLSLRSALPLLMMLAGAPALAHEPMTHDCITPVRPADDQNDEHWRRFLADIDDFQACITEAADRHQAASEAHIRAAHAAVNDWNDFVHHSLNAPEDFPWPPEDAEKPERQESAR